MTKILEIHEILKIIPHQKNLLMIDRAQIINSKEIHGIKNVTSNELFFLGHFPDNPIMPGILQFEIMLQLANLLYNQNYPKNEFLFPIKINKIRFKNPVIPGDQIFAEVTLEEIEDTILVKAILKTNKKICSQGNFIIGNIEKDKITKLVYRNTLDMEFPEKILYNTNHIATIIPHRFPFNFVDSILYNDSEKIIGKKLISVNDPACLKNKDNLYYIPHSHIIESAAQVACISFLIQSEDKNCIVLFLSIKNCEILDFAIPGDEVIFKIQKIFVKKNLGQCQAQVYTREKPLLSLEIAFGIVPK